MGLLLAQRSSMMEEILLSLTSGGFVYVATVSILPMLTRRSRDETTAKFTQLILESLAFVLGIFLMVMVALLEEFSEDHTHHHHHHETEL